MIGKGDRKEWAHAKLIILHDLLHLDYSQNKLRDPLRHKTNRRLKICVGILPDTDAF